MLGYLMLALSALPRPMLCGLGAKAASVTMYLLVQYSSTISKIYCVNQQWTMHAAREGKPIRLVCGW